MSVLEIPRIYFRGEIAWDPVTTNNYPVGQAPAAYDEDDCESKLNKGYVGSANVAAFRQAAIDEVVDSGNWNPQGSYRCPMFDTSISGVDTGGGLDTADPFVSAPVDFSGMLVDSEPYGAYSSQLFFDTMSFGIAGGCRIFGNRVQRFSDRYINFAANPTNDMIAGIASVMWQNCFPKDQGLQIDAHDSKALKALLECMDDPDVLGAMVRFCTYRTVYYDDPSLTNATAGPPGQALQRKLNAGGFQPNPARSLLVGTVGLWRRGEPVFEPADRALLTTGMPITVSKDPAIGKAVSGTAWALVGEDRVTLDLSNCIPGVDRAPQKVDLGDLILTTTDPPRAVASSVIATIPFSHYDRAAYDATSGVVDIPIAPALAKRLGKLGVLSLTCSAGTLLTEAPLRAVPADPNLYINEGGTVQTQVQVLDRGLPAGAGVTVTMSELGASQPTAMTQTTDAAGKATFTLHGTAGDVVGLVLQPGANPVLPMTTSAFDTQTYTYMYLRILPADDAIATMDPTWANVHNYVLSNWEAMAPCMDNWLLLGDEQQVLAYASLVKKLTHPDNFESFRYMPVTRDLTPGQRTLLYRFLDGGVAKGKAGAAGPEAADGDANERDFHRLSRATRSR